MKDIVEPAGRRDDIDRIVDALLENPNRAADIKTLLRQKILAPDVVHVAHPVHDDRVHEDDPEDIWDNVPV